MRTTIPAAADVAGRSDQSPAVRPLPSEHARRRRPDPRHGPARRRRHGARRPGPRPPRADADRDRAGPGAGARRRRRSSPPGSSDRLLGGTVSNSLAAAGIPDDWSGGPRARSRLEDDAADVVQPSVASAIALHVVYRAGRHRGLRVVEVTPAPGAGALRGLGRIARRRPTDRPRRRRVRQRAARAGRPARPTTTGRPPTTRPCSPTLPTRGPDARARLASSDPGLAAELAVRGWAPWQVLLGAVGRRAGRGAAPGGRGRARRAARGPRLDGRGLTAPTPVRSAYPPTPAAPPRTDPTRYRCLPRTPSPPCRR